MKIDIQQIIMNPQYGTLLFFVKVSLLHVSTKEHKLKLKEKARSKLKMK